MRRTHRKILFALLAALLLTAGCGNGDDEDDTPAVQYKVLDGRLVWCSGGAEDMIVPGNASSIGNNAFSNCGSIGTLTIPASVTYIMRYTFSGVRVGKIIFGGTVAEWADMAEQDGFGYTLDGTLVICSDGEWKWIAPAVPDVPVKPNDWQITDGVLVRYTGSAADVTIPDGVTAIGVGAFAGCTGITHVTIPNGVTEIRADSFKDCTSLAGVTIPDSVANIGENAFTGCDSLTNIDIPASVETVGAGAIPAGTAVTYHGTAERWDELAADGGLDGIMVFITDGSGTLTGYRGSAADITVPGGITAIAGEVFAGHTELEHIAIPAGVTSIAPGAFAGSGITEITYGGTASAWDELVTAGGIADELAGITVTCADGTWTPAHTHTWSETYTNGGESGHYRTCTECGEHSVTEEHAWGGWHSSDEADGHCQTCSVCGAHTPTEEHDYTYTSSDADYHTEICPVCNETRRTAHQYDGSLYTDDKNGGHYKTCTLAGCDAHSKTEEHDYDVSENGDTHTKTCTANCGYSKTEAHTWGEEYTDNADGTHTATCTECKCSTTEAHRYKDDICEVCGCPDPTKVYVASTGNDDNPGSRLERLATIQKAVDTVIANNDGTSAYTIYVDGTLSATTTTYIGANGMADFSALDKNLTLTIKALSGTATLDCGARFTVGNDGTVTVTDPGIGKRVINAAPASGMLNLTLENLVIKGGNVSYDFAGGICLKSAGGVLIMTGCEVSDNKAYYGGGVYVGSSATFTMEGGTISGNTATIQGGGIYVYRGAFTMQGGEINGNTTSDYSSASGGGICVGGGTFTMEGGTISGNTATSNGGGVYVDFSATFTMESGTISGNEARSEGGGVYVDRGGTFTMQGGTVSGNTPDDVYPNNP